MGRFPLFFRLLTLAALAEWLIARTVTRTAIFMPKPPPVIAVYQTLTFTGQLAFTVTSLLVIAAMVWIAWEGWRRRTVFLPLVLVSLIAFSLVGLFVVPAGWATAGQGVLLIAAVVAIVQGAKTDDRGRVVLAMPALAILSGVLYQLLPAVYSAMRWPGPPPLAELLFNLGELFAVATPAALWWGRRYPPRSVASRRSIWAALPALAFVVAHFASPAMTAIIAIWSAGLTLYLPWPIYAASLWLAGIVIIESLHRDDGAVWALFLLAAGGYAPQLSTHMFLGLIALWLLASQPSPTREERFNLATSTAVVRATD